MFFAANMTFRRRRERERRALARIEAKREVSHSGPYSFVSKHFVRILEKGLRKKKQRTKRTLRNVQKNQYSSTFARRRMKNKRIPRTAQRRLLISGIMCPAWIK